MNPRRYRAHQHRQPKSSPVMADSLSCVGSASSQPSSPGPLGGSTPRQLPVPPRTAAAAPSGCLSGWLAGGSNASAAWHARCK
jgi:hypothetical protein